MEGSREGERATPRVDPAVMYRAQNWGLEDKYVIGRASLDEYFGQLAQYVEENSTNTQPKPLIMIVNTSPADGPCLSHWIVVVVDKPTTHTEEEDAVADAGGNGDHTLEQQRADAPSGNQQLPAVDEGRAESGDSGGDESDGKESTAEDEYIGKWLCVVQEASDLWKKFGVKSLLSEENRQRTVAKLHIWRKSNQKQWQDLSAVLSDVESRFIEPAGSAQVPTSAWPTEMTPSERHLTRGMIELVCDMARTDNSQQVVHRPNIPAGEGGTAAGGISENASAPLIRIEEPISNVTIAFDKVADPSTTDTIKQMCESITDKYSYGVTVGSPPGRRGTEYKVVMYSDSMLRVLFDKARVRFPHATMSLKKGGSPEIPEERWLRLWSSKPICPLRFGDDAHMVCLEGWTSFCKRRVGCSVMGTAVSVGASSVVEQYVAVDPCPQDILVNHDGRNQLVALHFKNKHEAEAFVARMDMPEQSVAPTHDRFHVRLYDSSEWVTHNTVSGDMSTNKCVQDACKRGEYMVPNKVSTGANIHAQADFPDLGSRVDHPTEEHRSSEWGSEWGSGWENVPTEVRSPKASLQPSSVGHADGPTVKDKTPDNEKKLRGQRTARSGKSRTLSTELSRATSNSHWDKKCPCCNKNARDNAIAKKMPCPTYTSTWIVLPSLPAVPLANDRGTDTRGSFKHQCSIVQEEMNALHKGKSRIVIWTQAIPESGVGHVHIKKSSFDDLTDTHRALLRKRLKGIIDKEWSNQAYADAEVSRRDARIDSDTIEAEARIGSMMELLDDADAMRNIGKRFGRRVVERIVEVYNVGELDAEKARLESIFPRSERDDRLLRCSKLQSTLLRECRNEILPEFQTEGFVGRTIEYQQHNWKCPPETGDSVLFGRKYAMAPTVDVKDPSCTEMNAWVKLMCEMRGSNDGPYMAAFWNFQGQPDEDKNAGPRILKGAKNGAQTGERIERDRVYDPSWLCGSMYPHQKIPHELREVMCKNAVCQWDMVNAFGSIMHDLTPAKKRSDYPTLLFYATNRPAFFAKLRRNPGCEDLKDADLKELMFLVLFGGSIDNWEASRSPSMNAALEPTVAKMRREIKQWTKFAISREDIVSQVIMDAAVLKVHMRMIHSNMPWEKWRSRSDLKEKIFLQSALALTLQHHENLLLEVAVAESEALTMPDGSHPKVNSLIFDGYGITGVINGENAAKTVTDKVCEKIRQGRIPGTKKGSFAAFGKGYCGLPAFELKVVDKNWAKNQPSNAPVTAKHGFSFRPSTRCSCLGCGVAVSSQSVVFCTQCEDDKKFAVTEVSGSRWRAKLKTQCSALRKSGKHTMCTCDNNCKPGNLQCEPVMEQAKKDVLQMVIDDRRKRRREALQRATEGGKGVKTKTKAESGPRADSTGKTKVAPEPNGLKPSDAVPTKPMKHRSKNASPSKTGPPRCSPPAMVKPGAQRAGVPASQASEEAVLRRARIMSDGRVRVNMPPKDGKEGRSFTAKVIKVQMKTGVEMLVVASEEDNSLVTVPWGLVAEYSTLESLNHKPGHVAGLEGSIRHSGRLTGLSVLLCIPSLAKALAEPKLGIAPVFNFARTLDRFRKRGKATEGDIVATHGRLFRVGQPTETEHDEYVNVTPLSGGDAQRIHRRALSTYSIQTDGSIYTAARAAGSVKAETTTTLLPLKQPDMAVSDKNSVLEGGGKKEYSPKEFIESLMKTVRERSVVRSFSATEQTCKVCGSIKIIQQTHEAVECTAVPKDSSFTSSGQRPKTSLQNLVSQAARGIGLAQSMCDSCKGETSHVCKRSVRRYADVLAIWIHRPRLTTGKTGASPRKLDICRDMVSFPVSVMGTDFENTQDSPHKQSKGGPLTLRCCIRFVNEHDQAELNRIEPSLGDHGGHFIHYSRCNQGDWWLHDATTTPPIVIQVDYKESVADKPMVALFYERNSGF